MSSTFQEYPNTLDPAACWGVIERVAATAPFRRAARLREFLLFVAAQSLKEGRTTIHEQEIGETVFGRARSYDTGQDNIVRVSATELRKRIDAYFAADGSAEPIIFEIPRGSYLPAFRLRESTIVEPATPSYPDPAQSLDHAAAAHCAPSPAHNRLLWIVTAITAILAIACIILWRQNALLQQRIDALQHQHSQLLSLSRRIPPTT